MKEEELLQGAIEVQRNYKTAKCVYATSDGEYFLRLEHAVHHASQLEDKNVFEFENEAAELPEVKAGGEFTYQELKETVAELENTIKAKDERFSEVLEKATVDKDAEIAKLKAKVAELEAATKVEKVSENIAEVANTAADVKPGTNTNKAK